SELERLAPPAAPRYDRAAIARHLEELTALDRAWENWFAAEGIAPLRLRYETLATDPRAVLGEVLAALGRDPALASDVAVPTARLADATSAEWIARFRTGA
ncbi:MAG: Stf0 family sulfotransferase, partial [Pseudomonadota bacterium]